MSSMSEAPSAVVTLELDTCHSGSLVGRGQVYHMYYSAAVALHRYGLYLHKLFVILEHLPLENECYSANIPIFGTLKLSLSCPVFFLSTPQLCYLGATYPIVRVWMMSAQAFECPFRHSVSFSHFQVSFKHLDCPQMLEGSLPGFILPHVLYVGD